MSQPQEPWAGQLRASWRKLKGLPPEPIRLEPLVDVEHELACAACDACGQACDECRYRSKMLQIAQRIRFDFGYGGATFPGARELYEAAAKIEAWAVDA